MPGIAPAPYNVKHPAKIPVGLFYGSISNANTDSGMQEDSPQKQRVQWLGLILGPILAGLCLLWLPTSYSIATPTVQEPADGMEAIDASGEPSNVTSTTPFPWAGRATLAVMVWMGTWWLTEAIHISLTALLPIVLFPLLGATPIKEATFPYANPLIFLYFGGFVLALSMERWGLGKRIALITLRIIGTTAPRMIAGFMLVTAVLSAFVSNTATTTMMLPIALSVIALLKTQDSSSPDSETSPFGTCLLLSIAYSASVGGVMTIIGTPTNTFLVGFLRETIAEEYRRDFSFVGWLPIGVSLAAIFLPIVFLVMTRILFPIQGVELSGGKKLVETEIQTLGQVHRGEWNTLIVFCLTVSLWLFRPLIANLEISLGGVARQPFAGMTDPGIAMLGAMLLFLLPVDFRRRTFTMDWDTAAKIPWGILLLFGGGLSLAAAIQSNGVAEFLGSYAGRFGTLPPAIMILLVTMAIIFLTELTSNAATTASLVPVLAALAPGLGMHPYQLVIPATVAASCAFMLPVATPPNAIVFGSGAITLSQMMRAGILLNLIAVALVTLLALFVFPVLLGLG